jgi:glycosyltransferase involved in cell wall biosynthesis
VSTRLTVLSVAYPFAPVGPDAVGGAEQVLSMIDEALVAAGHRSIVLACAGSSCAGELAVVGQPEGTIDDDVRQRVHATLRRTIDRIVRERQVDVVHVHGVDFCEYMPTSSVPLLATLHLPLASYARRALEPTRRRTWLCGVSASQMRSAPKALRHVPIVGGGVRLDRFAPLARARRRYALCMGRICPEKGFDLALQAAQRAGVPLLLAGRAFPYESHLRYFREEIAPRLRAGCRFIGPVGPLRKRWLLARARCLLVPSRVAETGSLVAMEALACGTPPIAFPVGALPEVIEHGRTGFLVEDVDAMARSIREAHTLEPRACRAAAEQRFSSTAMAARYLQIYAALARARPTEVGGWLP